MKKKRLGKAWLFAGTALLLYAIGFFALPYAVFPKGGDMRVGVYQVDWYLYGRWIYAFPESWQVRRLTYFRYCVWLAPRERMTCLDTEDEIEAAGQTGR